MRITYFVVKIEDTGMETSIDGIEKLTPAAREELGVTYRSYIDPDTLSIYLQSNPNIPVGCNLTAQVVTL